ncbi:hypothetical protein LCGC14_0380240 [marine sediment metagenome]|uniref:Uncharacterized protein n=1 Tax=marine sediment metagenome TaxID=412755 RepID=A0A0F9WB79_9ZZZZ
MAIINVFRVTSPGDGPTVSDRIDFNDPSDATKDTSIENAFITKITQNPTDGIGNNQGSEQKDSTLQALGSVENIIRLEGFISKRNGDLNDGNNAFLALLHQWADEPKQIKTTWRLGRMGIESNDNINSSFTPDGAGIPANLTIALLWERIEFVSDIVGNRELFTLWLRVNRGDGT